MAVIDCKCLKAGTNWVVLGQILCTVGNRALHVLLSGCSHALIQYYNECLESNYRKVVVDFLTIQCKTCHYWNSAFRNWPYFVWDPWKCFEARDHLELAKNRADPDWMQCWQSLRKVIELGDLSRYGLMGIVYCEQHHRSMAVFCLSREGDTTRETTGRVLWYGPFVGLFPWWILMLNFFILFRMWGAKTSTFTRTSWAKRSFAHSSWSSILLASYFAFNSQYYGQNHKYILCGDSRSKDVCSKL